MCLSWLVSSGAESHCIVRLPSGSNRMSAGPIGLFPCSISACIALAIASARGTKAAIILATSSVSSDPVRITVPSMSSGMFTPSEIVTLPRTLLAAVVNALATSASGLISLSFRAHCSHAVAAVFFPVSFANDSMKAPAGFSRNRQAAAAPRISISDGGSIEARNSRRGFSTFTCWQRTSCSLPASVSVNFSVNTKLSSDILSLSAACVARGSSLSPPFFVVRSRNIPSHHADDADSGPGRSTRRSVWSRSWWRHDITQALLLCRRPARRWRCRFGHCAVVPAPADPMAKGGRFAGMGSYRLRSSTGVRLRGPRGVQESAPKTAGPCGCCSSRRVRSGSLGRRSRPATSGSGGRGRGRRAAASSRWYGLAHRSSRRSLPLPPSESRLSVRHASGAIAGSQRGPQLPTPGCPLNTAGILAQQAPNLSCVRGGTTAR